ncbi:MAG: hypothetical protein R3C56_16775 [Pirellulaceae bacterium]
MRSLATCVLPDESGGLLAAGHNGARQLDDRTVENTIQWPRQFSSGCGARDAKSVDLRIAFDATGEWLVRGTSWGEVRLTKLSTPERDFHLMLDDYQEEVLQVQIVEDKLIAAFADATILIWNFYECQMVYEAHVIVDRPFPNPVNFRPHAG